MHTPPPLPGELTPRPPRTWWSRHWAWCLPVGMLLAVIVIAGMGLYSMHRVAEERRNSEPYSEAMRRVHCSPELAAQLGSPITDSSLGLWASYVLDDDTLMASNAIKGPHDSATMVIRALETDGQWRFTILMVRADGQDPIALEGSDYENGGCPLTDASNAARTQ